MHALIDQRVAKNDLYSTWQTVPLKSKLPVMSRFLRDENLVAHYVIIITLLELCSARIIEAAIFGKKLLTHIQWETKEKVCLVLPRRLM